MSDYPFFMVLHGHVRAPLVVCCRGVPSAPALYAVGHVCLPLLSMLQRPHRLPFVHVVQGLFDVGHGTVLDSGTTFTYLPSQAFRQLHKQVSDFALSHGLHTIPGPDPSFRDTCFGGAPSFDGSRSLEEVFPSLELHFQVSILAVCPRIRKCVHLRMTI